MAISAVNASVSLTTTANTTLYGPTADRTVALINFCNRGAAPAKVRLAIAASASPADAEWIEFDCPLAAAGSAGNTMERGGISISAGKYIVVRTDTATVSAFLSGVVMS